MGARRPNRTLGNTPKNKSTAGSTGGAKKRKARLAGWGYPSWGHRMTTHYRKKYREFAKAEGKYNHSTLYQPVRDPFHLSPKNRNEHPRTTSPRHLEETSA